MNSQQLYLPGMIPIKILVCTRNVPVVVGPAYRWKQYREENPGEENVIEYKYSGFAEINARIRAKRKS